MDKTITRREFLKLSGIMALVLPQMNLVELIESVPQPQPPSFLDFDGETPLVDYGTNAKLDDLPTFTAEMWIKGDSHIGNQYETGWVSLPCHENDLLENREWRHLGFPFDNICPRKIHIYSDGRYRGAYYPDGASLWQRIKDKLHGVKVL